MSLKSGLPLFRPPPIPYLPLIEAAPPEGGFTSFAGSAQWFGGECVQAFCRGGIFCAACPVSVILKPVFRMNGSPKVFRNSGRFDDRVYPEKGSFFGDPIFQSAQNVMGLARTDFN